MQVTVCHCADCQVLSGAPFRTVVAAPIGQFKLTGEPKRYVVVQSGKQMAQAFCPECATPLFAAAPDSPTFVGLFDLIRPSRVLGSKTNRERPLRCRGVTHT